MTVPHHISASVSLLLPPRGLPVGLGLWAAATFSQGSLSTAPSECGRVRCVSWALKPPPHPRPGHNPQAEGWDSAGIQGNTTPPEVRWIPEHVGISSPQVRVRVQAGLYSCVCEGRGVRTWLQDTCPQATSGTLTTSLLPKCPQSPSPFPNPGNQGDSFWAWSQVDIW